MLSKKEIEYLNELDKDILIFTVKMTAMVKEMTSEIDKATVIRSKVYSLLNSERIKSMED